MPRITRLQVQRRRKDRVNVFVDDAFECSLALDLAATLRSGQDLSDAELTQLRTEDDYRYGLDRAMRYLAFRPRSEAETRKHLEGHEHADDTIVRVVARLAELDLIDDVAFAQWWVDNRTTHRPRGCRALRHELAIRGVDPAVIADSLAEVDEEELALRVALEKAHRYAGLERAVFERRLSALLARRGFGGLAARSALNDAWRSVTNSRDAR